jgi:hypothetical protein
MNSFEPRLDILPPAQRRLWDELGATPEHFVLYGGTAIALRLGHRHSEDFDFFSGAAFSPSKLKAKVAYLRGAETIEAGTNTLTCIVERGGPVKVSFFGGWDLNRVGEPEQARPVWIASPLDLLALKLGVLPEREASKDYLDVDALLGAGLGLRQGFAAALAVYGPQFNPYISLKALTCFEGGDLHRLDAPIRQRLTAAAKSVDPQTVRALPAKQGPR